MSRGFTIRPGIEIYRDSKAQAGGGAPSAEVAPGSVHQEKQHQRIERRHGKLEGGDRQSITQEPAERDRFAVTGTYTFCNDAGGPPIRMALPSAVFSPFRTPMANKALTSSNAASAMSTTRCTSRNGNVAVSMSQKKIRTTLVHRIESRPFPR